MQLGDSLLLVSTALLKTVLQVISPINFLWEMHTP